MVDVKTIFEREDVSPAIYLAVLNSQFPTWLTWSEPQTLWTMIGQRCGVEPGAIPQVAKDKMSAIRSLSNQSAIFQEMDAYENAVLAFNDQLSTWDVLEQCEPEQMSWFHKLVPAPRDKFSRDVQVYAAAILGERGWVVTPPNLQAFQAALDEYSLQRMDKEALRELKASIRDNLKGIPDDDDEDPVSVAAARYMKCRLYVLERQSKERKMRSDLGLS